MMRRLLHRYRRLGRCARAFAACGLSMALLFQTMIPVGFMPASDGSFGLQICHSGMPSMPYPGHSGGHSQDYCPFAALPGVGPIMHRIASPAPAPSVAAPVASLPLLRFSPRPQRAHPPRGPPLPA
jgi:hypothetical protein